LSAACWDSVRHLFKTNYGYRSGLAFPESVAAAEIHKAGQKGSAGAKFLFQHGSWSFDLFAGCGSALSASKDFIIKLGKIGSSFVRLGAPKKQDGQHRRRGQCRRPGISPAYVGVGYIIGPRLASSTLPGAF
jgi:uncharacterized oligopeptide transporter (OPT) family protein